MAPDIRLILTDIDGTILPYGQHCVSARGVAAFHAALNAGMRVGPASGRGFSHIPASFGGDAACSATCLATNGMEVYLDGRLVYQAFIPVEPTRRMAKLLRHVARAGLICFQDGVPLLVEGNVCDLEASFPLYASQAQVVDDVPGHPMEKVNIFVNGTMEYTHEVLELLQREINDIDFNVPMKGFVNTLPVGWSKASGIDVLCDAMGIGIDQVVVFGDGGNDVEMLQHVPNSVAVANAVPEAFSAARWHIGSCEDEAAIAAIEELAAGRWPFRD
ncbi:MAG: HAD family hydrolase [Coriobacteriales bacterium]|nr:HAD family hydrolase [Coriobacteriales bacterium]